MSREAINRSAASSSTPIEPPSGIPGNATAVLSLENSCVVGTSAGRLALHVLEEIEGSFGWRCVGAVSVHRGVSVDSILLLLPNLLLVCCAGELSVRALPDLQTIAGGVIAPLHGAVCVQEKGLATTAAGGRQPAQRSGSPSRGGGLAEAAARVCAAMHDHLLLLDVDDGSGDAQVGALRLRSKRYARIQLSEPAVGLLWRDAKLCVAHSDSYVVLDATSGAEVWRVHLRTPTTRPMAAESGASSSANASPVVSRRPSRLAPQEAAAAVTIMVEASAGATHGIVLSPTCKCECAPDLDMSSALMAGDFGGTLLDTYCCC